MKADIVYFDFTPIGKAIQASRENAGDTRAQIAEMVGISDRHLQGVEKEGNYPSVELLIWLAKRYHVSIDQFIFEDSRSKSTARRNAEAALDKLNDQELEYIEKMAKELYALREPEK